MHLVLLRACTHTHTLTDSQAHTGALLLLCTHTHPVFGGIPAPHYSHTSTTGIYQRHRNPLANWFKHLHTNQLSTWELPSHAQENEPKNPGHTQGSMVCLCSPMLWCVPRTAECSRPCGGWGGGGGVPGACTGAGLSPSTLLHSLRYHWRRAHRHGSAKSLATHWLLGCHGLRASLQASPERLVCKRGAGLLRSTMFLPAQVHTLVAGRHRLQTCL